ncbi:putative membrane protein, partial [Cucurbita argyrosperma subsp. argyrosperma]
MGSRIPSHQLSGGLYVSGRPEQLKERPPTMGSRAVPYTGGDVKKSGELGKMFDLHLVDSQLPAILLSKSSRPSSSSQHNSGSHSNSVRSPRNSSGPISLPPNWSHNLRPFGSVLLDRPVAAAGGERTALRPSGADDVLGKTMYRAAGHELSEDVKFRFKVSKVVCGLFLWFFQSRFVAFWRVSDGAVKKADYDWCAAGGLFVRGSDCDSLNIALGKRGIIELTVLYAIPSLLGRHVLRPVIPLESFPTREYRAFKAGLEHMVKAGCYGPRYVKKGSTVSRHEGVQRQR